MNVPYLHLDYRQNVADLLAGLTISHQQLHITADGGTLMSRLCSGIHGLVEYLQPLLTGDRHRERERAGARGEEGEERESARETSGEPGGRDV